MPGVFAALTIPVISKMIQNAASAHPMILDDCINLIQIFSILMIPFRGLNADYSEKEIRKCQNLFQITPKSYPNLFPSWRNDKKITCIPDTKSKKKWGVANH